MAERTPSGRYRVALAEVKRIQPAVEISLCAMCGAALQMVHDSRMSTVTNRRLHQLIGHVYPAALAQHERDGSWPTREGGDPAKREDGQAPFVIDTTRDGQIRLRLTSADGDLIAGVGPDLDAALVAIADKLKVALDAPGA